MTFKCQEDVPYGVLLHTSILSLEIDHPSKSIAWIYVPSPLTAWLFGLSQNYDLRTAVQQKSEGSLKIVQNIS